MKRSQTAPSSTDESQGQTCGLSRFPAQNADDVAKFCRGRRPSNGSSMRTEGGREQPQRNMRPSPYLRQRKDALVKNRVNLRLGFVLVTRRRFSIDICKERLKPRVTVGPDKAARRPVGRTWLLADATAPTAFRANERRWFPRAECRETSKRVVLAGAVWTMMPTISPGGCRRRHSRAQPDRHIAYRSNQPAQRSIVWPARKRKHLQIR